VELSELADLVAEDPDVIDPFLVYADHLQETGDPRGELISLDLSRLEDPYDRERVRAVGRHLDRHHAELLGPLIDLSACLTNLKWRLGFLERVTLLHPQGDGPSQLARWIELIFDAPAGKFLRDLTITPLLAGDYTPVIQTIAEHGRSVRRLRIGPGTGEVQVDLRSLSSLSHLQTLAIAANRIRLSTLHLPSLAELELWLDEVTAEHLRDLALSDLPSLRAMSLALNATSGELTRLLLTPMPKLESFRIDSRRTADLVGFVYQLAHAPIARQLKSLTIDELDGEEVDRLAFFSERFSSLERITIGSRTARRDQLEPFAARQIAVTMRQPAWTFDPWDDQTDIDLAQEREVFIEPMEEDDVYLTPEEIERLLHS
jgi:uncharacterized protein (TIGR02996 family)